MKRWIRLLLAADELRFALVIIAALAVHWIGSTSEHMLEYWLHHGYSPNMTDLEVLSISVAVLVGLWLVWLYSGLHAEFVVRSVGKARTCEDLVLFLSLPCPAGLTGTARDEWMAELAACRFECTGVNTWCPSLLERSSWRMPLQGIIHHATLPVSRLRTIHVICSRETQPLAPMFRTLIEQNLGNSGLSVVLPKSGIDFEDFEDVSDALHSVLHEIGSRAFLVDFTGGTKVCSAVAAAICFERGRHIQYVHAGRNYAVMEYDLIYRPPEALRPGG